MASFSHARRSGITAPDQASRATRLRHAFPPRPKSVRVWPVHPEHEPAAVADSLAACSAPKPGWLRWALFGAGMLLFLACVAGLWAQSFSVIHLTK